ncbi:hypothetical protein [Nocardioides halotolerans]|jgi:hypothetical protein|uniref:hypothetical protein n=1 Tax=Nocardioides halotolerans TaxID=433660 RepID=UPI00040261FE|nr:hypothetical protein [Nocardioides halotolerans]
MSPSRARYVTACQQLLALGVVVIALVPATRVVSLDVVGVGPGQGVAQPSIEVSPDAAEAGASRAEAPAGRSAFARQQQRCAPVGWRVVERRTVPRATEQPCWARGRHARGVTPGAG